MPVKAKPKIYIKPSKRGTLRKAMGTKPGKNISSTALAKKKNAKGTTKAMKKKIVFAQNAKKWAK